MSYRWVLCFDTTIASCTYSLEGGGNQVYGVSDEVAGRAVRVAVTVTAIEGDSPQTVYSSALRLNAEIACGDDCYRWTAQPQIDRDGFGGPTPASGRPATLVDNGQFVWDDPTSAPVQTDVTVGWFECTSPAVVHPDRRRPLGHTDHAGPIAGGPPHRHRPPRRGRR